MSETARAHVGAKSVTALPCLGGGATLARHVCPAGGSRQTQTAAAAHAPVRGAWPMWGPDVPERLPAEAVAHVTRRHDDANAGPRGKRSLAWMSSRHTRRSLVPRAGTVRSRDTGGASWGLAALTLVRARARSHVAESPMRARATALLGGTAGLGTRAVTPSRWAVSASFWPSAGRVSGLWVVGPCARRAPRVRARGVRRRRRAGGAPLARRDRRRRAPPAAPPPGDVLGVERVVCGLAAMAGRPREGLAADTREAVVSPEVSQPGPRSTDRRPP